MTDDREKNAPSFRVVDRRLFDDAGELRRDLPAEDEAPRPTIKPVAPPPAASSPPPRAASVPPPKSAPTKPPVRPTGGATPPGLNFATFCLSLAGSAQVAMGLVANPHTRVVMKDLMAAQQTIEILALLQEKTQGNLNEEEDQVLKELLYTLRMQFVEVSKMPSTPPPPAPK